MDSTYWQKQGSKPLYPDLEWNKPERRDQAGRLLIVGGSTQALEAPAKAYELALKTGIGSVKIVLPDKTKRLVGATLPDAVFLPSTSSGEFSKKGSDELLSYAQWTDTVLLAGDIGRNSQTTILLETLLRSYSGQIIITKDAIESLSNTPKLMLDRANTSLVISFSQLQRILKKSDEPQPLQFAMNLAQTVAYLQTLTAKCKASIITMHANQIIVAVEGAVSTTKLAASDPPQPWRLEFASLASCYQTWYPEKPLEALTHTSYLMQSQAN